MASQWMIDRVKGTSTQGSTPSPAPVLQKTQPIQKPTATPERDLGLLGKGINTAQNIDKTLSTSAWKAVSTPYNTLKNITGGALKGLNKVFVEPVDRFVAGGMQEAQDVWKNPKLNPIQKTLSSTPISLAARGARNVIKKDTGTFGDGVDVTAGLVPDKQLVTPEMGKKIDNPVTDFLIGKGTAGQLATSFSNPRWGANLAANIATPGIPAADLLKVAGKTKVVQKVVGEAGDIIRASPTLTKVAETIKPGSIFPEFQKVLKESDFNTNLRQTELYKRLQQVTANLSPVEKKAIGQMMEGGIVATAKKGERLSRTEQLKEIATEMNNISNKIGQELVDTGIISPESYLKYKDKYLTHISTEVFDQLQKEGIKLPKELRSGGGFLSGITTRYSKQRTGKLTDYERNFAPVMMTGLGSEIKAIEKNKALEKIVGEYGTKLQDGVPIQSPVNEALNELLQEGSKRTRRIEKFGLGTPQPGYTPTQNMSSELLDVFRKNQPAQVTGRKMGTDVEGILGDVTGGGEKVKKGYTKLPNGQKAYTQTFQGYRPIQASMDVGDLRVGQLPQKQSVMKLPVGRKVLQEVPKEHIRVSDIQGLPEFYRKKFEGVSIPQVIADKITNNFYRKPGQIEKAADFLLNTWKRFKTTASGTPAYFVRNQNSNIGQMAIETHGNVAKAMKENISAMAELGGLKKAEPLLEEYLVVSNAQSLSQKVKNLLTGKDKTFSLKSLLSPNELQSWQENGAKYAIYKYHRASGMDMRKAWERANKAIFSPVNISQAERGATKYLMPFYNWQRQEIPYFLKTYAKNPERYASYTRTKDAIERLSPEPENLPEYMKGQIRLPSKDEQGNQQYLDASYHLPFGTFTRSQGENDLPLGFGLNPIIGDLPDIAKGRNPQYGTPLTRSNVPEEQDAAKAKAIRESLGPNIIREVGNLSSAVKGEAEKYTGRKRTVGQWVARQLGTKITSFSPEKQETIDRIGVSQAKKNFNSMKYTLLDQLKRGVITRQEYDRQIKLEQKALQELQSK